MAPIDVLLRWRLPQDREDEQRRVLQGLWHRVPSYTQRIGGVSTCYASRQPSEARFTLFTTTPHAEALATGLEELFERTPDQVAVPDDPILAPEVKWYRERLHQVSDIALSIRDDLEDTTYRLLRVTLDTLPDPGLVDRFNPPAALYEGELRRRLILLAGPAMERTLVAKVEGSSFWKDFVRRPAGPEDGLRAPGHLLWNLLR